MGFDSFLKLLRRIYKSAGGNRTRDDSLRDEVLFVSFPKTGRTWLRVILDDLKVDIKYTHGCSDYRRRLSYKDIDIDKHQYESKRLIFLIREPKDVVVSNYFQAARRDIVYKGNIHEFIRDERYGIKKAVAFYDLWFENRSVPKAFLVIRYEDMHKDTLAVVKRVLEFLGIRNVSEDTLRETVQIFGFANMRRLEQTGYFEEDYGKRIIPRNIRDEESFKLRRGKVGGYIDYLTEEDTEYCNKAIREMKCPWY